MNVMTEEQRRGWAEAIVLHDPPRCLHINLTIAEAQLRIEALFVAAAKLGRWTYLPKHLALLHVEMLKRSKK